MIVTGWQVIGVMAAILGFLWLGDRAVALCRDEVARFRMDEDTRSVRFIMLYVPHMVEAALFAVLVPFLVLGVVGAAREISRLKDFGFAVCGGIGLMMMAAGLWKWIGSLMVKRGMPPRRRPKWEEDRDRFFKGFGR